MNAFEHAGAVLFNRTADKYGFLYSQSYNLEPIDPINLDYKMGVDIFELKGRNVLHDAFRDALPGRFAAKMISAKYPEYKTKNDVEKLWFIGTREVGGLRFFSMVRQGEPRPAQNLNELIEFSKEVKEVENGIRGHLSQRFHDDMKVIDGGARKKWRIRAKDKTEWIVKFNEYGDDYNNAKMECMTLKLMDLAKIKTPGCHIKRLKSGEEVIFIKRFDCDRHNRRQHKISIAALLGKRMGADFYDIVRVVNQVSCQPEFDVKQLYRSMLFDCVIGNHDNHLKNFEMVLYEEGYKLSPQFDKLPDNSPSSLVTSACDYQNADILDEEFIIRSAEKFEIKEEIAREMRNELVKAIQKVPELAKFLKMTDKDLLYIKSCINRQSKTLGKTLGIKDPTRTTGIRKRTISVTNE